MATHFAVSALKLNTKAFKYASDALVYDARSVGRVLRLKEAVVEIAKRRFFAR